LIEIELGESFSLVAFGPVWLDLTAFGSVVKGEIVLFEGGIGSGTVGVEHVVVRVDFDCLCEMFDRFFETASLESCVTQLFKM
jgi:hypothetical protein